MSRLTHPTTPSTERGEETRRQILELAARVISEHGYGSMSLNDLVRRSHVTKGAFYFHFRSKEDLALQVHRFKHEQWAAHVSRAIAREPKAIDRLLATPRAFVELHRIDPAARAFERMCVELSTTPAFRAEMRQAMEGWQAMVAEIIRDAQAEGDIRDDLDVEGTARCCVGAFIGMEELSYALTDGEDLGRRVEEFIELLLRAATH